MLIKFINTNEMLESLLSVMLRHKDGHGEREECFIGRFRYALTMLPGENNARNY